MIRIKKDNDIVLLKESGRRLATILRQLIKEVKVGVLPRDLDDQARQLIKEFGDKPAFLNYRPRGSQLAYPAALCVSVNDVIVHGIPDKKPIQSGDVVTLDLGLNHRGDFSDMAITVVVDSGNQEVNSLLEITKQALALGIAAAKNGNHVGDIGWAIENYISQNRDYGIVRDISGHGVGFAVHEDPAVPNYGQKGQGEKLVPGLVLAIEPMITLGKEETKLLSDGFTFVTLDGSISAHFEHTVLSTKDKPIILTV